MTDETGACPRARAYPFSTPEALELDPTYAKMRAEEPLTRIKMAYGAEGWLATRYDDVRTVLSDPRFSRKAVLHADVPRALPELDEQPETILTMDPPEHGRLRRLVAAAFTARRVEGLRPRVREIAEHLVDEMVAASSPADLVESVSMPLPVVVICELLGVPLEGRPVFRAGADAALSNSSVSAEERLAAVGTLCEYIASLIAERRNSPGGPADDLLGALISARDTDGDRLTEGELVMLGVTILVAGHETTMNMTGNMVSTLLADRSRWEALVAAPDSIPRAIEEMLRMTPVGVHAGVPRIALEDVELSGGTVRAGEAVLVATAAANRDPEVFDDPENLHLHREPGQHVAFGFGPHHCLGASLARMELQIILTTLVTRLPSLDLAGEVQWRTSAQIRGPKHLPVRW